MLAERNSHVCWDFPSTGDTEKQCWMLVRRTPKETNCLLLEEIVVARVTSPEDTISVPLEEIVVMLATPPAETNSQPPSEMVVPLATPPAETISTPSEEIGAPYPERPLCRYPASDRRTALLDPALA
jgi:hypothetical protein